MLVEGLPDPPHQFFDVEGLGDVVEDAVLHELDGFVYLTVGSHDDDGDLGIELVLSLVPARRPEA